MKSSQVFPSTYLSKDDVARPIVAVIEAVTIEEIKGENGKEQKPVMHFKGGVKPMILNRVNWTTCEKVYGDDSDFWGGKSVEVYHDPSIMFGNKRVGGVRLRIPDNRRPLAWTIEQALAACEYAGVTKDQLREAIAAKGFSGWNPLRDTATAQALIQAAQEANGTSSPVPSAQEDIPFSWLLPLGLTFATMLLA